MDLFKNIDGQLTDYEKQEKVPQLIEVFKQTNLSRKITGKKICELFLNQGYPLTQQRLCLWISYIRQMNLMDPFSIIGARRGYFITDDPEIIRDQIESLTGRISSMRGVIDALEAQRQNIIKGKIKNVLAL
jgi:hypothetical protein